MEFSVTNITEGDTNIVPILFCTKKKEKKRNKDVFEKKKKTQKAIHNLEVLN